MDSNLIDLTPLPVPDHIYLSFIINNTERVSAEALSPLVILNGLCGQIVSPIKSSSFTYSDSSKSESDSSDTISNGNSKTSENVLGCDYKFIHSTRSEKNIFRAKILIKKNIPSS